MTTTFLTSALYKHDYRSHCVVKSEAAERSNGDNLKNLPDFKTKSQQSKNMGVSSPLSLVLICLKLQDSLISERSLALLVST